MNENPETPATNPVDVCEAIDQEGEQVDFACGHSGAPRFKISLYGVIVNLQPRYMSRRERCGSCEVEKAKSMVTRCVACRRAILPGDEVAISTQGAVCMRKDCSGYMGAGALSGHWTGTEVRPLTFHDSPKLDF